MRRRIEESREQHRRCRCRISRSCVLEQLLPKKRLVGPMGVPAKEGIETSTTWRAHPPDSKRCLCRSCEERHGGSGAPPSGGGVAPAPALALALTGISTAGRGQPQRRAVAAAARRHCTRFGSSSGGAALALALARTRQRQRQRQQQRRRPPRRDSRRRADSSVQRVLDAHYTARSRGCAPPPTRA